VNTVGQRSVGPDSSFLQINAFARARNYVTTTCVWLTVCNELAALRNQGTITEDEYQAKRKEILDSI
jgi:putative oligomerization/nucleic acid binding protein